LITVGTLKMHVGFFFFKIGSYFNWICKGIYGICSFMVSKSM